MYKITPDYYFYHFYDITVDFLKQNGIESLLCDIDNTLAPYEVEEPDETIIEWVRTLTENGIKITLVSNNTEERVTKFIEKLMIPAYFDARKPSIEFYVSAMKIVKVPVCRTAVLGDQLLTDGLSAARLGVRFIMVPPINDKKNLFFKAKRALEAPLMKKFFQDNDIDPSREGTYDWT
jgi:HAD superfamily phosphatase (TIGR01668 family)